MSICKKCAKLQVTCCQRSSIQVAVTCEDIRRIKEYTNSDTFYELRPVENNNYSSPAEYGKDEAVYITNLFDAEGRRNVLKHKGNGECVFLGASGCILPMDVRPLLCVLYPYNWNDDGEIWVDPYYCPRELFKDESDLLSKVAVDIETAKRLVKQLYEEISKK